MVSLTKSFHELALSSPQIDALQRLWPWPMPLDNKFGFTRHESFTQALKFTDGLHSLVPDLS